MKKYMFIVHCSEVTFFSLFKKLHFFRLFLNLTIRVFIIRFAKKTDAAEYVKTFFKCHRFFPDS